MSKSDIKSLLDRCRSGDPAQQIAAIHGLLEMKAYAAIPEIIELLRSADPAVRFASVQALVYLVTRETETVGNTLMNLLDDPEAIVRSEATDALGILRYTPVVKSVKSLLRNDPEPLVRASAAETLGDLGDGKALVELEFALHDPDESVRAYAAGSIGLLGTHQILPRLQNYIEAEHSVRVKAELFGARYRLGASEDINLLLGLLDTADENLATAILNILTDLTERKIPEAFMIDAPRIQRSLTELAQRLPILQPHAEEVMKHLGEL